MRGIVAAAPQRTTSLPARPEQSGTSVGRPVMLVRGTHETTGPLPEAAGAHVRHSCVLTMRAMTL